MKNNKRHSSQLSKVVLVLFLLSILSVVFLTSASDDGITDTETQTSAISAGETVAPNTETLETATPEVATETNTPNTDDIIINKIEYVEKRELLDISMFSDVPVSGIKERKPGSPIVKISALGFFLVDVWAQLPANYSKGTQYNIGVFGLSASVDIFPTRSFWFLGLEYDWITTAYKTNLHFAMLEGGYMFRPVKHLYLTPTLGVGVVFNSRSFDTTLPLCGWNMSFGFAISYEFYEGLAIELEPKMFFGSEKHNPFSFVPLTVGMSYSY